MIVEDSLLTRLTKSLLPERKTFRELCAVPSRSVAERFPHVPAPDDPLNPELLAARWTNGDLHGEDMPGLAADLLEKGLDSPSLRRLAGEFHVTHTADVKPLVDQAFLELGIAAPLSELSAKRFAARQIARQVIHGQRNPWEAAAHLECAVWGWSSDIPEILEILQLNEFVSWHSRDKSSAQVEEDLFEAFARLAVLPV